MLRSSVILYSKDALYNTWA